MDLRNPLKVLCLYRVRRDFPKRKRWTRESVMVEVAGLSSVLEAFAGAVARHQERDQRQGRVSFRDYELTGIIPDPRGDI